MPQTTEHRVDCFCEYANEATLVTDAADRIVHANAKAAQVYGYSVAELLGRRLQEFLAPGDKAAFERDWAGVSTTGTRFAALQQRRDGSLVAVEFSSRSTGLNGQRYRHNIIRALPIGATEVDWSVHAGLLEQFPAPVWCTDADGNCIYVNTQWRTLTGCDLNQTLGKGWLASIHPDDRTNCIERYWKAAQAGQVFVSELRLWNQTRQEYRWVLAQSQPYARGDEQKTAYLGLCQDIHETKTALEQIRYLGHHDPLTDLPNQVLLEDRLHQALASAQRNQNQTALLFLDLDCFRLVNDSFGHKLGDRLLQVLAERLRRCLRESDTLSRRSGDEFVVLLANLRTPENAATVAEKLLRAVAEPVQVDGQELNLTASIGISFYPHDGDTPELLLRNADTALYHAKRNGRNRYEFFAPAMNTRTREYLVMQGQLRRALERNEFELHYQPQVDLRGGRIIGAEALLRWRHPEVGLIPPGQFIPVAEECGLIVPIGEWVLQEACRQNRQWQQTGLAALPIAVNFSAIQFRCDGFQRDIELALRDHRLAPACLELELTEGVVMQEAERAAQILKELKAMGVRLSIDDFGTGYSSLSYLKRFPIDRIKVDRSFVHDMILNEEDAEITRAIIGLGHGLGLKVIAEGVETQDQLKFLRWQKCDDMQGYYFSKPLPAGSFEELLQSGRTLH